MRARTIRTLAALAVVAMLAAACGQKEGVHVALDQGGAGQAPVEDFATEDPTEGFVEDDFTEDVGGDLAFDDPAFDAGAGADTGAGADAGTTGTGGAGGTGGTSGTGGTGGTGGQQPSGQQQQPSGQQQQPSGQQQQPSGQQQQPSGQQQQPSGQQQQPSGQQQQPSNPNDTIGVSAEVIKIGIHAPLSGAAPLPQQEFESGREQYWRYLASQGQSVGGRRVEVEVRDDQYNPSRATSVCNELIQRAKVFLLVGGGGADQIAACARTAAQQGVPYLSAGVDEGNLRQLRNYFAVSMSYVQQAPLVAQYIVANHRPADGRVAIVRDRTPSFTNAIDKLKASLDAAGLQHQTIQYSNGPSTAQQVQGFSVAFAIMAPSDFVQMVRSPGGANPQWVGMGITMGLNTVASTACQGGNPYKGTFFSPFPGLDAIGQMDPNFAKAGGKGDIELALWGLNKTIHAALAPMGENITRSGLIRTLESTPIETGVYPNLRHSPDNHFGATSVHVLTADCSKGQYVTRQRFASSF